MQSSNTFNKKYLKKLPLGLILLVVFFAATVFLFSFIAHEILLEKETQADKSVLDFLSARVIRPQLTAFMKGVTYFASATFLQIGFGILVISYLLFKNYKRAIEIAAIGIGGFLVNYFMKLAFHRIRPPHPLIDPLQNYSFPSGHATSGFIFYGLLVYLIWKTSIPKLVKYAAAVMLLSFCLLIGFSRVYLRVHYPSDVIAGFCIGFAWLSLTIWLFERLKKKSDKEIQGELVK